MKKIIGCAVEVHRNLGAGLLESAYHQCLIHELNLVEPGLLIHFNVRRLVDGVKRQGI